MISKLNRRARWLTLTSLIVLQAFLSLGSNKVADTITHMFSSNVSNHPITVEKSHVKSSMMLEMTTAEHTTEPGEATDQAMPEKLQPEKLPPEELPSDKIPMEAHINLNGTNAVSIASYEQQVVPVAVTDDAVPFDERAIIEQYEPVAVTATGYYAGPQSTGKDPSHPEYGITYSGLKVVRNRDALSTIAADIEVFPLGTVLYIPGYGYGVVADTGSAVKGNIIDLYFETIEDVYNEWGKKDLDVYVIEKGEGKLTGEMFSHFQTIYTKI